MSVRIHEMYYAIGEYDSVIIFEASDNQAAPAVVLAAVGPGNVSKAVTTDLRGAAAHGPNKRLSASPTVSPVRTGRMVSVPFSQ